MLLREHVTTAPTRIVPPQNRPVRLQLWAVGSFFGREETTGVVIYLAHTKEEATRATGIPLPFNQTVLIDLEAGQQLFAVSSNEGFLGISVLER